MVTTFPPNISAAQQFSRPAATLLNPQSFITCTRILHVGLNESPADIDPTIRLPAHPVAYVKSPATRVIHHHHHQPHPP